MYDSNFFQYLELNSTLCLIDRCGFKARIVEQRVRGICCLFSLLWHIVSNRFCTVGKSVSDYLYSLIANIGSYPLSAKLIGSNQCRARPSKTIKHQVARI